MELTADQVITQLRVLNSRLHNQVRKFLSANGARGLHFCFQSGYYGWPHSADGSGPSAAHNTTVPPGQHPQQGQELSDMLQMLGEQGGPTTFEDLNIHMFSGQFE